MSRLAFQKTLSSESTGPLWEVWEGFKRKAGKEEPREKRALGSQGGLQMCLMVQVLITNTGELGVGVRKWAAFAFAGV